MDYKEVREQSFYFSDGPYLQALQGLYGALCAPGAFVKLIGQPRTGKTGVCEKLAQFLQRKEYQVVYFDYAIESPEMLRAMLARELNLPNSASLAGQLEELFVDSAGKPIVIIFDDAHQLSDVTLLEIYRLADIQLSRKAIINILLCGEPSIEKRLLDKEKFDSLHHHVSSNYILEPMSGDTTAQFLAAYLTQAGLPQLQLDAAAMAHFYRSCKGFPGLASSMAHLLVEARAELSDSVAVSKEELLALTKYAGGDQPLPTLQYRENKQWLALGPLTAVLVIASLAVLYQQLNSSVPGETEQLAADDASAVFIAVEPEPQVLASLVLTESTELAEVFIEAEVESPEIEQLQVDVREPEPVSDSNLSLVTAEEIGLTAADIAEPVFEDLAIDPVAGVVRVAIDEELTSTTIDSDMADEKSEPVAKLPADDIAAEVAKVSKVQPATPTKDSFDEQSQIDEASVNTTPADPLPELALAEDSVPEEIVLKDTVAASPLAQFNVRPEPGLAAVGEDTFEQSGAFLSRAEVSTAAPLSVEQTVQDWVNAWEGQAIDTYFSSYHPDFVPRYHNSRSEWRRGRERVIGNANRISLQLSDFTIISEDTNSVEVHFWLAYQSPTYRDNTRKKLVLQKQAAAEQEGPIAEARDKWLIIEEVNLEVRT